MCYNFNMTTKTALVRARIQPSIKKKAEMVLSKIGISPSEAINVFYRRIVSDKGIPFSLHVPNAKTRTAIRAMKRGEGARVSLNDFIKEMRKVSKTA